MPNTGQEKKQEESKSEILTHIDVLDKLLGLEEGETGIKPGSIILIRGEPGSGKTTLGLQILSQNLKKIRDEEQKNIAVAKKEAKAAFFSLEGDSDDVLLYAKRKYGFFESEDFDEENTLYDKIFAFDAQDMNNAILGDVKSTKRNVKNVLKTTHGSWVGGGIALIRIIDSVRKHSEATDNANLVTLGTDDYCPIVFVDSLTVLLHLLGNHEEYTGIPERLLLNEICDAFRKRFPKSIIIFTGEYHFKDVTKKSAVSESFFCDIEIALFSEPIMVHGNYESQFESPLGSNTLYLLNPEKVKSIQTQSFCRVLKSRQTPNQTRRCAYDIVSGKGIEFYETYPGDGHLTLFAENGCQEEVWKILFDQSLPHLYPSLRYDSFDRGSLQRISAAQRRFRYVPQRTDVYLSSFDNYWINWYSEMCLKANIADILKRELEMNDFYLRSEDKRLILLNNIYAALSKTKNQVYFGRKIRELFKEFFEKLCKDHPVLAETKMTKDTFNEFLSGLLNTFSRIEPSKDEQNKTRNMNRPCLRCLWDRSLLRKLCDEFKSQDEISCILTYCHEGLPGSQEKNAINETQGERTAEERIKDKLRELVKDVASTCSKSQADNCSNKLEEHCSTNSDFGKFLKDKSDNCNCKKIVTGYIAQFIAELEVSKKNIERENLEEIKGQLHKNENVNDFSDKTIEALENNIFQDIFSDSEDDSDAEDDPQKRFDLIRDGLECLFDKMKECTNENDRRKFWVVVLARLFFDVMERPPRYRLISPIHGDKLRLYGERRSKIIDEMESHHPDTRRPVHRPWHLFSLRDQNAYCSVPYDANISFVVFRKDLLRDFYNEKSTRDKNGPYQMLIKNLVTNQYQELEKKIGTSQPLPDDFDNLVTTLVKDSEDNVYPTTWEEIIAYYLLEQKKNLRFLIETRSPDSYLCTMLEFIWSCGANLRIFPNYSIDQRAKTLEGLMRSFYLMGLMFQDGIIPVNSTLEVNEFSQIYGHRPGENKIKNQPDWVFARHWYSTFVDILSAPNKKDNNQPVTPITEESNFLWQPRYQGKDKIELGIMPIPVSFSNYAQYRKDVWHISCWGDWHMAMLSGSENVELGADLINELMSSDRICERAFANAGIPTVEAFYEQPGDKPQYGDKPCLNQPTRKNIKLPDWTYNNLRQKLFKHAKSRSQIFDYHHCIREFHSVMEYIHFRALQVATKDKNVLNKDTCDGIYTKLDEALKKIESFKKEPFLMA